MNPGVMGVSELAALVRMMCSILPNLQQQVPIEGSPVSWCIISGSEPFLGLHGALLLPSGSH